MVSTDDPAATELENFYFFFDAANTVEIEDKVRCSAFLNAPNTLLETLLRPELMDCGTICLANKRTSNTVYFSGINIRQLRFFLQWQHYPESFQKFICDREGELDHLLFDVGVDVQVRDNEVQFVKSGIYGIF